jgi:putative endonuclease
VGTLKADHLTKGTAAEKAAEEFLCSHGLSIVSRNFSSRFGEIDLICEDKKELVFVEVRFRSNTSFGSAAETVTIAKQRKLTKTAHYFLSTHPKFTNKMMRFDVIGMSANSQPEWIKGAFLTA